MQIGNEISSGWIPAWRSLSHIRPPLWLVVSTFESVETKVCANIHLWSSLQQVTMVTGQYTVYVCSVRGRHVRCVCVCVWEECGALPHTCPGFQRSLHANEVSKQFRQRFLSAEVGQPSWEGGGSDNSHYQSEFKRQKFCHGFDKLSKVAGRVENLSELAMPASLCQTGPAPLAYAFNVRSQTATRLLSPVWFYSNPADAP